MSTARIVVQTIAPGVGGRTACLADGFELKPDSPAGPMLQKQTVEGLVPMGHARRFGTPVLATDRRAKGKTVGDKSKRPDLRRNTSIDDARYDMAFQATAQK